MTTQVIETQIENLRQEIGKPNKNRGLKVRDAAIRFQEHFKDRPFKTDEFLDWMRSEPSMGQYMDDATNARNRLQAAGYRDDMPVPFEIHRTGKSEWRIRTIPEFVLSDDLESEIAEVTNKQHRKLQHALQACDFDALDRIQQFAIVSRYRDFKNGAEDIQRISLRMKENVMEALAAAGIIGSINNGTEQPRSLPAE